MPIICFPSQTLQNPGEGGRDRGAVFIGLSKIQYIYIENYVAVNKQTNENIEVKPYVPIVI